MKGVALSAFSDIHTHGRTGADIICSIEPGDAEILERSIPGRAWFSVGIHPWSTGVSIPESTFELLDKLSSDERVAAIGEAGLDALRGGEASYQEEVFLRQAALAEKVRKPLISIVCVVTGVLWSFMPLSSRSSNGLSTAFAARQNLPGSLPGRV